jgi:hypothetical protein
MTAAKRTLKVIILDDETNMETAIASKLPKAIGRSSAAINPNDITSVVKELGGRAAAVRSSKKYTPKELQLDSADLFIVDYDLVKANNEDYLTGEALLLPHLSKPALSARTRVFFETPHWLRLNSKSIIGLIGQFGFGRKLSGYG